MAWKLFTDFAQIMARWARSTANFNTNIHIAFHEKHSLITKIIGGMLHGFYALIVAPAFAVFLAFILVGFVISGAIPLIVSLSAFCAWLVVILSVARWKAITEMTILPRVFVVLFVGVISAFVANRFVNWSIANYVRNQPQSSMSTPSDLGKSNDELLYRRLSELFQQELAKSASKDKSSTAANTSRPLQPREIGGNEDVDIKLLRDAERLWMSLSNWHHSRIVDRGQKIKFFMGDQEEQKRLSPEVLSGKFSWVYQMWWNKTLTDYQQTYAPELIRLRREMLAVAPQAALQSDVEDWQDPGNGGGITGIEFNFQRIIELYRKRLRAIGKIDDKPTAEELKMTPFDRMNFILSSTNP